MIFQALYINIQRDTIFVRKKSNASGHIAKSNGQQHLSFLFQPFFYHNTPLTMNKVSSCASKIACTNKVSHIQILVYLTRAIYGCELYEIYLI